MNSSTNSKNIIPHASSDQFSDSAGRILLVGGFLGAGKTTFLRRFENWLTKRGLIVGMVANDQGSGLIDALNFETRNAVEPAVEQVTGGCFCCKLDELGERLGKLSQAYRPDVILAEPVGSCTDLMATVVRPLEEVYTLGLTVGTYAVLVDGGKLLRFTEPFSADVEYIFSKQLEEAEIILISKADLLGQKQRDLIEEKLVAMFPGKEKRFISATTGEGLEDVFSLLMEPPHRQRTAGTSMEMDYHKYAEGEAKLGWYNAEISIHAVRGALDGNKLLLGVGQAMQKAVEEAGLNIAHLKLSLEAKWGAEASPGDGHEQFALVQATSNQVPGQLSRKMAHPMLVGNMLINIRAEGAAYRLQAAVKAVLAAPDSVKSFRVVWQEEAAFQPGRPVPQHRIA